MMISMDKQYRTEDGREVRIYAVDGRFMQEVHGAILENNGWADCHWPINGKHDHISYNSLVEVKPRIKREFWVNLYEKEYNFHRVYLSKDMADEWSESKRVACVKITIDCEEGEGL